MTRHPTAFLLYANGRPSTDLDKLGALVQTEADKLVSDGPTTKELNRVKKVIFPSRCSAAGLTPGERWWRKCRTIESYD